MRCFARVRSYLLLLFILPQLALAQCPGDAFQTGDFSDWDKRIGYKGFGVGVETIITPNPTNDSFRFKVNRDTSAVDLQIGSLLKVIPEGHRYSIRLGDYINGAKAERMSFEWQVSPSNNILYYKYAIVTQQPNHAPEWLPTVAFLVRDQNDSIIECSQQTIIPGYTNIPLQTANSGSNTLKYTNWRTVAIDVSAYEGETLTFEAMNSDCGLSQHFSYSYFVVDCGSKSRTAHFCEDESQVEIVGPPGFDTYQWSTGDQTKDISVLNATAGDTFSCLATTFTCTTAFDIEIESSKVLADFDAIFDTVAVAVQLQNTSTAFNSVVSSLFWDFGDGKSSSVANPLHVYDSFGVFDITLFAESNKGCRDLISVQFINYPPPYPDFKMDDSCGLKTSFTNLTLPPLIGDITGYQWDFGDNTVSREENPIHRYQRSGDFLVTLTAEASGIKKASISKKVNVYELPVVDFDAEPACVGNPTDFFNASYIANGDTLAYEWFFDQTMTTTELEPTVTFETPQLIDVLLQATSSKNCVAERSKTIEIFPKTVVADFEFDPTEIGVLDPRVWFSSTSVNATKWNWELDGSTFSDLPNPGFEFAPDTGAYEIELMVENEFGCAASTSKTLHVGPELSFYIPNSFSPDGDGINDGLIIKGEGVENVHLVIGDRWGAVVHESSELNVEIVFPELSSNLLFYTLTYENDEGRAYQRQGTLTVIR